MRPVAGNWVLFGLLAAAAPPAPAGEMRLSAVSGDEVAALDARIEAMRADGRLRVKREREDTLVLGRRHQRYAQHHKGVKVWGAEVVRQQGAGGAVSIFGT
jgi:hypothetical protein